jgi:hypothetical protein
MSEENLPNAAEIEAQVRAKMEAEFAAEKDKILGNRDQILAEKKELEQKYKGFDQEKMEGYQNYLKELENNEEMRLISEGKHDEVIQRRMSGREKAWNETQAEYETRLQAAQEKAEGFASELDAMRQRNIDMQKRQYFKDLTLADDSFKKDYFGDFFELQSKFADIDESTGAFYALDEQGKRRVDTDGNLVRFDEYYNKLKVTKGLFWSTGSGSGVRSGSGVESSVPFKKMDMAQRSELRKQLGDKKYAEFVKEQAAK